MKERREVANPSLYWKKEEKQNEREEGWSMNSWVGFMHQSSV